MKKKLSVWLLWPFAVFLLGVWHLLDVRASVTETGHHWLYGWYGGLFFVSMVVLVGIGIFIFGKNWGFFDSVSSESRETSRTVFWYGHVSWHSVYAGFGASFSAG